MSEYSQLMAKTIFIVGEEPDSLIQISVKNWLLQSEQNFSINEITFENFVKLSEEAVKESDLFLLLRTEDTVNELPAALSMFRRNGISNAVLVIDFSTIDLLQIKEILQIQHASIVSAKVSGVQLLRYISNLSKLERVLSADITDRIIDAFLNDPEVRKTNLSNYYSDFSMQEQSIIDLAIKGLSIRETAETLGLSPNTIAVYRSKMIKKAGISSFKKLLEQ